MLAYNRDQELSLLSKTEVEWLLGEKQISGSYNRKIKSQIIKKIKNFESFELPLLLENGLISLSGVTKFGNGVTNISNAQIESLPLDNDIHLSDLKNRALGGNSGVIPHFRSRDLFLTKETLYQAELPRRYIRT